MGEKHIERKRLEEILSAVRTLTVGVLGDLCVDVYWHADMKISELSRETPHFPLPIIKERFSLGAGGNVVANVASLLPAKAVAIGVKGHDWRGGVLTAELERWGIDASNVIEDAERITFAYCKPMRKGISNVEYEDPRLDFINYKPMGRHVEDRLIQALESLRGKLNVLLVSDQFAFGCITPRVREAVCDLGRNGLPVVVDSRDRIGLFSNVILKPNEIEGAKALGLKSTSVDLNGYFNCVTELAKMKNCRVLMTLGAQGSVYSDGKAKQYHIPWKVEGPVDIVGAGDAFLSGFSCALAAGATVGEAADFAGLCSAVTIAKIGITGTASPEELIEAYRRLTREGD